MLMALQNAQSALTGSILLLCQGLPALLVLSDQNQNYFFARNAGLAHTLVQLWKHARNVNLGRFRRSMDP